MTQTPAYFVDQAGCAAPYGRRPSRVNGCGWIAAYNYCLALGALLPGEGPAEVRAALAPGLRFGGALGTGPLRLARWLRTRLPGVRLCRPGRAPAPGILLYWTGRACLLYTSAISIMRDVLEGLTSLDENNQPIPGVAESWDVSANADGVEGTVYTFHLRDNAVWSNGDPVTANDFVFALTQHLSLIHI